MYHASDIKRYLRFGDIPPSGRSVNFLKLTNEQNETFTWLCENGEVKKAFTELPPNALEAGISVFNMESNGFPKLDTLMLLSSMLGRLDKPIYEVSGIEVSRGNDNEPLIRVVNVERKCSISEKDLIDFAISVLQDNFENSEYDPDKDFGENRLNNFYVEYKINTKTGERISRWEPTGGKDWKLLPGYMEYCLNGWTFWNPKKDFCVQLGINKDVSKPDLQMEQER